MIRTPEELGIVSLGKRAGDRQLDLIEIGFDDGCQSVSILTTDSLHESRSG